MEHFAVTACGTEVKGFSPWSSAHTEPDRAATRGGGRPSLGRGPAVRIILADEEGSFSPAAAEEAGKRLDTTRPETRSAAKYQVSGLPKVCGSGMVPSSAAVCDGVAQGW